MEDMNRKLLHFNLHSCRCRILEYFPSRLCSSQVELICLLFFLQLFVPCSCHLSLCVACFCLNHLRSFSNLAIALCVTHMWNSSGKIVYVVSCTRFSVRREISTCHLFLARSSSLPVFRFPFLLHIVSRCLVVRTETALYVCFVLFLFSYVRCFSFVHSICSYSFVLYCFLPNLADVTSS